MRKLVWLCAVILLLSVPAMAQDHPKAEIFGGYSYLRVNPGGGASGENFAGGWAASAAINANSWIGLAADFSGHYKTISISGSDVKLKVHSYTFGPRFSYRKSEKVQPYFHALFGGATSSASAGGISASESAFAMQYGGGIDWVASPHLAIRVGQFDYIASHFGGDWQHNFAYSAGIVFRFGGR